jgi:hypothetical protein
MLVVVEFLAKAAVSRPPTCRAVDLGGAVDDRGYRFSADSAVAAGFVFMARNAPTSRIAALQS